MRPEPVEAAPETPSETPSVSAVSGRPSRDPGDAVHAPRETDARRRGARLALAGVTAAYLCFLAWLTLTPQPYDPAAVPLLDRVLALLQGFPPTRWMTFDVVEFSANVALFVPLAVLLLLLLGAHHRRLVLAVAVALTCSIELAQAAWLPTRVSDPRDVVANTAGAALGIALVLAARRVRRRGRRLRPHHRPRG